MLGSLMTNKEMVEAGGGKYVGIQEGLNGAYFIMFNNPATKSTLALSVKDICPKAVEAKIIKDCDAFEIGAGLLEVGRGYV